MIRIWLNHWFSSAYNIINLIKKDEKDFYIIGSSRNNNSVVKSVCDEWYQEPEWNEKIKVIAERFVTAYPAIMFQMHQIKCNGLYHDALDVFENSESDATLILGEKNGFAQAVLVSSEGKYTMSPVDYVEYWAKNAIDLIGKTAGLVKEDYCECGDAYMDAIINGVPTKGATLSRLV